VKAVRGASSLLQSEAFLEKARPEPGVKKVGIMDSESGGDVKDDLTDA